MELKLYHPLLKNGKSIVAPMYMHPDMVVEEHHLKAKYLAIWKSFHELELGVVFGNSDDINVNFV